jgi:hypothetical protein
MLKGILLHSVNTEVDPVLTTTFLPRRRSTGSRRRSAGRRSAGSRRMSAGSMRRSAGSRRSWRP